MKLQLPIKEHHKEVIVISFANVKTALAFSNNLTSADEIIELIPFFNTGAALILSTNDKIKASKKYNLLSPIETLQIFYNLKPGSLKKSCAYFEKLNFIDLFKLLDFCSIEKIDVIEISTQRTSSTNSLLISFDETSKKLQRIIQIHKGAHLKNISDPLRRFFDITEPT